jgi:hypothetical protein
MRLYIQRKLRGALDGWVDVKCVHRGNNTDIAGRIAEQMRKEDHRFVFRVRMNHPKFPCKRNNPFVTAEQRAALVEHCKAMAKTKEGSKP